MLALVGLREPDRNRPGPEVHLNPAKESSIMTTPTDNRSSITQPSRRLKHILLAAALSFTCLVPAASAKCFRDFREPMALPALSAALAPTQNGDAAVEASAAASIVGLWTVTFTAGGQTVDVGYDAWHSDGTEILNDYTNPIEGNVCLGVWEQTGPRTYRLKHPSWSFDTTGTLLGTVVIHETVQLSPDGNSYIGSYRYDIYDLTGAFVEELTGQLRATRIRPN